MEMSLLIYIHICNRISEILSSNTYVLFSINLVDKNYLNVVFDAELVEEEKGEDDNHGDGNETELVRVDRALDPLLPQLLTIVNLLPLFCLLVYHQAGNKQEYHTTWIHPDHQAG